jgi:hypothetical protein
MNIEPTKAYVYQPDKPRPDGKFYGVSGPHSLGFADGNLKGLTLKDANEIARVCNDNPEFAKSFISQLRHRLDLDSKSFDCGCQFESVLSNAVSLCEKCDEEMHGGKS